MSANTKIYLEQLKNNPSKYRVKKLTNRTVPEISTILTRDEVQKLQANSQNLTVEITEESRPRTTWVYFR